MDRRNKQFIGTKKCRICSKYFEKSPKLSYKQFFTKQTCSKECLKVSKSGSNNIFYGKPSWNKGLSSWAKSRKLTDEEKKKLQEANKGRKVSSESRIKMSLAKKGVHRPNIQGEKCHFWKGGITPENIKIRQSLKYRLWRESVFKRDNWTCAWCKQIGGDLNADHVKPFALYPELRFDLDNGRTLCVPCHRKTDTFAGKTNLILKK